MKSKVFFYCLVIFFITQLKSFAENNKQFKLDSLFFIINSPSSHDTTKVQTLFELVNQGGAPTWDSLLNISTKARSIIDKALKLTKNEKESLALKKALANTFELIGRYYRFGQRNDSLALLNWNQGLSLCKSLKYYDGTLIILRRLADQSIQTGNFEKGLYYLSQTKELADKKEDPKNIMRYYQGMGYYYRMIDNDNQSIKNYKLALDMAKVIGDKTQILRYLLELAQSYFSIIDTPNSIYYFYESLKLAEELGDKKAIQIIYGYLGDCYALMEDYEQSETYFKKAINLVYETENDSVEACRALSVYYSNMGDNVYTVQGNYEMAKKCLHKAIYLNKTAKYYDSELFEYTRLGKAHQLNGNNDSALFYYNLVLDKYNSSQKGSYRTQAFYLAYIGDGFRKIGRFKEAEILLNRGVFICDSIGGAFLFAQWNHKALYKLYDTIGDYRKAFYHLKRYHSYYAQKNNPLNTNIALNSKKEYDIEKERELEKTKQELKDAEVKAKIQEQKTIRNTAGVALILVLAFLGFIFNRLKVTKRQKEEIDNQKAELQETHLQLAEHHKEIKDSINYAKRIQNAIMPNMDAMYKILGNGFVLYLPKDIVAGDFFWMEQDEDTVYYAAADCTGHGVPGAMVSVVCSNALTKAFLEEGIRDTGKLLDKTRELVINQLAKSGEEVKDGMDISLCAWNKKTNQLQWSGANNPLWILRKEGQEIEETKADKQPIGVSVDPKPFTSHTFQLNEGDAVYVFTDGYQDQFGGPKGKKFKAAQLKEMLIENQQNSMSEQNELLKTTIQSWKGDLEQVDDICLIGNKI